MSDCMSVVMLKQDCILASADPERHTVDVRERDSATMRLRAEIEAQVDATGDAAAVFVSASSEPNAVCSSCMFAFV